MTTQTRERTQTPASDVIQKSVVLRHPRSRVWRHHLEVAPLLPV